MAIACVICLLPMEENTSNHMIPCGHCFHQACIIRWMKQRHRCPVCSAVTHENEISALFLNFEEGSSNLDPFVQANNQLKQQISNLNQQLTIQSNEITAMEVAHKQLLRKVSFP